MNLRNTIRSFRDVEHNFNLLRWVLGGRLDNTHTLLPESVTITPEGITAYDTEDPTIYARLGPGGLYIVGGASAVDGFGELAYEDAVELAKLGTTIIEGGYLVTGLINASRIDAGELNADRLSAHSITADKLNVTDLSAITGRFTHLLAGTAGEARLELGADEYPFLEMYDSDNALRVRVEQDNIQFYGGDGNVGGYIRSIVPSLSYSLLDMRSSTDMTLVAEDATTALWKCIGLYAEHIFLAATLAQYTAGKWPQFEINYEADYQFKVGDAGKVWSVPTYNNTTASAANMRVESTGELFRSTSAKKYKTDIEPLNMQYALNFLENCMPVWYRSMCKGDNPEHGFYGYIADEVIQVDPRIVDVDAYGNVEGFHYDRVGTLLHLIVKDNRNRISKLEAKFKEVTP